MTVFKDKRFCSDIFQFIKQHGLILPQKRYLLAVSGGIDSMVLLHFFQRFAQKRYGCEFAVAHLDHGLRPESSVQAEQFFDYCHKENVLLFSDRRTPVRTRVQSSLEAQSRLVRYHWFAQLVKAYSFDAVVVAHHANDQLETLLMQWVRGTSIPQGIRPLKTLRFGTETLSVIRPLLPVSRCDLEHYHRHHTLPYWEDISNQDPSFTRNRFRSQVLPLLIAENPNLEATITEHAVIIQQEQDYLKACTQRSFVQCVELREDYLDDFTVSSYRIKLAVFSLIHPALQRLVIKELLSHLHGERSAVFSARHIEATLQLMSAQSGKFLQLPLRVTVIKKKAYLLFRQQPEDSHK